MQRGQGEGRQEGSLIPLFAAYLTTQQAEGQECSLQMIARDVTDEDNIGCTITQIHGQIFSKGTLLGVFSFCHWRWLTLLNSAANSAVIESQGRGSLVGCHLRGHTESDTNEVT